MHDWVDGRCTRCDGVNTCAHTNTYEDFEWTDETEESFTFESSSVCLHTLTHVNKVIRCIDCDALIETLATDVTYTGERLHDWEDGKCTWCGGVNTCAHTNTFETFEWTNETEESFTFESSSVCLKTLTHVNKVIYCGDCDALIETLATDVTYT